MGSTKNYIYRATKRHLNIFDISNGLATRPLQRKVPLMFQNRGSTFLVLDPSFTKFGHFCSLLSVLKLHVKRGHFLSLLSGRCFQRLVFLWTVVSTYLVVFTPFLGLALLRLFTYNSKILVLLWKNSLKKNPDFLVSSLFVYLCRIGCWSSFSVQYVASKQGLAPATFRCSLLLRPQSWQHN